MSLVIFSLAVDSSAVNLQLRSSIGSPNNWPMPLHEKRFMAFFVRCTNPCCKLGPRRRAWSLEASRVHRTLLFFGLFFAVLLTACGVDLFVGRSIFEPSFDIACIWGNFVDLRCQLF
jgi:hypothetical protein